MRRPEESYDAIVVGGGIAGLTCAAYLSHSGLNPLLLERQQHVGGLINSFEQEGFVFDSGARAFESSGILLPMLRQLGIDLPLKRSEISIIIADSRVRLEDADSLDEYAAMLKSAFPDNHTDVDRIVAEIRRVMGYLDILYGIDNPLFAEDMKDKAYLKGELLPWFKKYIRNVPQISRLNGPVYALLRQFTSNESLIDLIAQHFFRDTPAFFALSYFSLYLDYIYPEGGTRRLPEAMSAYIKERGGEIRTESEVTAIAASRHELRLADGSRLAYKKLIWAADQSSFYKLTESDSPKFLRHKQLVEKSHGADSILTLFIGLDQSKEYVASHSGAHSFYTPETIGLGSLPDWKEQSGADLWDWLARY
ncbi:MAG: FAD-dependent oxidoreductase, partial [Eubacteriales bacterium]|nr:FAD-dependent oxidoreductase [Eubacteriales bacterium]